MVQSTIDYQPDVSRFTTVHVAPPRTIPARPRTFADMVSDLPTAMRDVFQRVDLALAQHTLEAMRDALNGVMLPLMHAQITVAEMTNLFTVAQRSAPPTTPLQPGRMPPHVIRPHSYGKVEEA